MRKVYTDEFKLAVIKDYYGSSLGIRMVARKYGLPSKNYITNWERQIKEKGLLPADATKPNKTLGRSKDSVVYMRTNPTDNEKDLETYVVQLEARIAYFESLDYMQPFLKKKKKSGSFGTK